MTDNSSKKVTIGFRGTEQYREKLQAEALARGIKVQAMLKAATELYLAVTPREKGARPKIETPTTTTTTAKPDDLLSLVGLDEARKTDARVHVEALRAEMNPGGPEQPAMINVKIPAKLRGTVQGLVNISERSKLNPQMLAELIATLEKWASKF